MDILFSEKEQRLVMNAETNKPFDTCIIARDVSPTVFAFLHKSIHTDSTGTIQLTNDNVFGLLQFARSQEGSPVQQLAPTAPLLDILPRHLHVKQRIDSLLDAILRYTEANLVAPEEWLKELKDLHAERSN